VLNDRLLDPHRDRVPSSNLADPFIAFECRKRLCDGFVERFRCHFQGVLVTVRVFARYRAGTQSHARLFSLLFAIRQACPTVGSVLNLDFWASLPRFLRRNTPNPCLSRSFRADARRRRFDAVLVYRYDRFARSLRQLVNALGEFDALGVHFISLHEAVDTSTPSGRLVFGIFASIAEFERGLITERVKSGQAAAKRRGVRFGRPRVQVDPEKLADLRRQGLSYANIAKATGVSVSTVFRAVDS